jgi:hypothetical protein
VSVSVKKREDSHVVTAYTLANLFAQAKTLVFDGTYITTPEIVLNGSEPVANVHLLMGVMRDEAGTAITWPPTTTNFSAFILQEGFNATLVQNAGYRVPNSGNATLDIFNVSARVDTDGEWRCSRPSNCLCRNLQQFVQKHILLRIQPKLRAHNG